MARTREDERPFRYFEREHNEGANILRGLLIAGVAGASLWALIIWGIGGIIGLFA